MTASVYNVYDLISRGLAQGIITPEESDEVLNSLMISEANAYQQGRRDQMEDSL